MVADREMPHWQLQGAVRDSVRPGHLMEYALDEHAISTLCGLICERKRGRETLRDEIRLAMRPVELEIVHGGSAAG